MHTHNPHHGHLNKHATLAPSGATGPMTTLHSAVTSGGKDQGVQPASAEDIRLCAYRKWESAGKPTGDGLQFWLEAEQELASRD